MQRAAAALLLLCILPLQVVGLITTSAKCLAGYNWVFSSIGQSPCDVAAELASVCVDKPIDWNPLPTGAVYSGPSLANQTSCMCNSVTYSLLSACAHCQGRDHIQWTNYYTNCTVIFLTVYTKQIPVGVKVPAYAYQDVSISNTFNVTLAQSTTGTESSRLSSTSTQTPTTSSSTGDMVVSDAPSIVGGVVGGLVSLGLIAALITFIVVRSKKPPKSPYYNPGSQRSRNMAVIPSTTASRIRSPPPGSPARANKATSSNRTTQRTKGPNRQHTPSLAASNNRTTHRTKDPDRQHTPSLAASNNRTTHRTKDPNRPHTPSLGTKEPIREPSPSIKRNMTPDATENTPTAQNVPPQMPEKTVGDSDDNAKSEL